MAVNLLKIGQRAIDLLGESIRLQGHNHQGGLIRSFEIRTKPGIVEIWGAFYSKFVDRGVRARQIKFPYARARIEALTAYFKAKGKGQQAAKNMAFATATIHAGLATKKGISGGMPTQASRIFSSTGKRLNFVDEALKKQEQIFKVAIDEHGKEFELQIDNMLKEVKII